MCIYVRKNLGLLQALRPCHDISNVVLEAVRCNSYTAAILQSPIYVIPFMRILIREILASDAMTFINMQTQQRIIDISVVRSALSRLLSYLDTNVGRKAPGWFYSFTKVLTSWQLGSFGKCRSCYDWQDTKCGQYQWCAICTRCTTRVGFYARKCKFRCIVVDEEFQYSIHEQTIARKDSYLMKADIDSRYRVLHIFFAKESLDKGIVTPYALSYVQRRASAL